MVTTRSSLSAGSERHHSPIPEILHGNNSESATISSLPPPEQNYTIADVPRLVQEKVEALEREAKVLAQLRDLQQGYIEALRDRAAIEPTGKDLDARDAPRITVFQRTWSLQQRSNWLQKLELRFRGAPARFHTEDKKVICALQNMSDSCQEEWSIYEKASGSEANRRELWNSYSNFVEWTLTLVSNSRQRLGDIKTQLEQKIHKESQNPKDFDRELAVLEDYFVRKGEQERALDFYAKLSPDLRRRISIHAIELPATRLDMVELATHFWEAYHDPHNNKKRKYGAEEAEEPLKHKGKGRSFLPGRDRRNPPKEQKGADAQRKNPLGPDGKPNTCNICNSIWHYAPKCPKRPSFDRKQNDKRTKVTHIPAQGVSSKTICSENEDELE